MRERGGEDRGQRRMRCRTMIDSFLAGSICHTVIGRKMEQRSSSGGGGSEGGGRGSRGGGSKPGGGRRGSRGTVSQINSVGLLTPGPR